MSNCRILANSVYQTFTQVYNYDLLNRLQDVTESKSVTDGALTQSWAQAYTYDRFGNRSINQSGTTQGVGLNSMQAAVVANTTNNRMYAPGETEQNHPLINYDSAGNQSKDYYSVAGVSYDRLYDAENRMVSSTATDTFGSLTSTYTYDANGARVKRNVAGTETWQVYGLGGELLAEYEASGAATSPQKEYGYRNGQLLITAAAQSGAETRANVALASNGATASAQNYTQDGVYAGLHFQPSYAIDGLRHTTTDGGSLWRDEHGLSSWLEVDFSGAKTIDEVDIITEQIPGYQNASDPTATQTFSSQGATAYEVQYWTGSAWATVPGGAISGNSLVWKKLTFTSITTTKIRLLVTGFV